MNFDFDLAVIGGGTGGLVSAFVADALGARVALVEAQKIGGECLWSGCVPSKTLLQSARVYETIKRAEEFGIHVEKARPVWSAIRLRIADVRDQIKNLEREELAKSKIEIMAGAARFEDAHTLQISSQNGLQTLRARKFIIATGSKAKIPDLPGLREAGFSTHADLFERPNLPRSLVFLGGGPIGCEMAQAFNRLGTKVTVLQSDAHLLPREEPTISAELERLLGNEGIQFWKNSHATRVEVGEKGKTVFFESPEGPQSVTASEIVVAAGKTPNFQELNLEAAGVKTGAKGIEIDAFGRTSAKNIWACGDVTGQFLFTHYAEHSAKIAAQNALLPVKKPLETRVVPWVTFTDPEVAHLGLTEFGAREKGEKIKIWTAPFKTLDRAIIAGDAVGFARFVTTPSGRILGVHILGPSAGELIAAYVPAVREGALLQEFAEDIFPYPTLGEIGHRAGNGVFQEILDNKWVRRALGIFMGSEKR